MTPRPNWKPPSRRFDIDLWPGRPVTDQKRSGRCWLYASLNPLRQRMCERYDLEDFRFSTNYLYFFDQLQKSEAFLDRMPELRERPIHDPAAAELLREPTSSVGQWCYFAVLAEEHGLAPLGFLRDVVGGDFEDFVMLMHHPSVRWPSPWAYHEIEDPVKRHPFLTMLSVDMTTIKNAALRQLRDGEQVVIAADPRWQSSRSLGVLDADMFDWDGMKLPKADAIETKQICACHVMSIDGWASDGR